MVARPFPWPALALPLVGLAGGPAGTALGLAALGWVVLSQRRQDAALSALAPDPAPAPVYPVSVWHLVRDCHRGRDRGLATFLDGWMLFEGRRYFALRAVDVRDAHPDAGDVEIVLKAGRRSMLIKGDRAFQHALYAWYRASAPVEGEPTLPT